MGFLCLTARIFLIWISKVSQWKWSFLAQFMLITNLCWQASGLGSMSSIAISYGESGPVFCGLKSDGSHLAVCYGANSAILYGTPTHLEFLGLTGGDGFMCGLLMRSIQPYCWGNSGYIQMGVPQPMTKGAEYSEISAGDYHLCGLRKQLMGRQKKENSIVDCWGYNMTRSFVFNKQIQSLSAGSEFNCGLSSKDKSVFCWGDETSSQVISLIPKGQRFQKIAAGGYHICGILEGSNSRVLCWGRSLDFQETSTGERALNSIPKEPLVTVVGGRFHACGIKSNDHSVVCWGYAVNPSTPAPTGIKFYELSAGNYFTCGVVAGNSTSPICWGLGFPNTLPLAVSPGLCRVTPCPPGTYEFVNQENSPCKLSGSHICLPCKTSCPPQMYQKSQCSQSSDMLCGYNCSSCFSPECYSNCSASNGWKAGGGSFWSLQLPVIVAEIGFALFVIALVSITAVLYVRFRLRHCRCSGKDSKSVKDSAFMKEYGRICPDLDELKIRRARVFTYDELEKAAGGFKEESMVGKGSFSCVYKGILRDGTTVAVKKAIMTSDKQKKSKEFHTELDLLSRLNHAHLLSLLGYCEEGGERLLVYEFMAHGSLYNHLHGKNKALKEQLDWVKRVTIAVQAARGIEYLHGYACPPVIHRDIKSSNILIDEEHNARVADFGLSLLGPADSSAPLAELPAGTLGYLDPEYYRLHYLTTKSDVYSFGVLLLEILSGRKAIDMQYEEGNIVEWAVPLIKAGDIAAILDPVLKPPPDMESLRRIASAAYKCVRMRGRDRPSMDKVTTALERGLAQLMGSPCSEQPILPTEVVLGSSRMHKKSWRSASENTMEGGEEQRTEFRGGSWITFPSVTSSQRRKSSASEGDVAEDGGRNQEGLRSLDEEIGPASPQQSLFLHHNF
ncbi:PREDICTED: serine/threonine-protein kinase-like protein ACR4 [Tarenaya hassleriana]|uniref:serine/threonine-protein kinase-like protein ACR4 n=1 Tax=Tarenaya hassleriana TaxID=28532 RepID=UPI00053C5603|nr:PREDICTED: serine/threonine-protein kinase-like protein ACR4 [Tarenaya hassleriana]XP_010526059.1 PREDICTED: serine/threonine-protein kinase-like protein ACR4 [Tarenaya hassleriana]